MFFFFIVFIILDVLYSCFMYTILNSAGDKVCAGEGGGSNAFYYFIIFLSPPC